MRAARENLLSAIIFQGLCCLNNCPSGVNHIINNNSAFPLNLTDNMHNFRNIRAGLLLSMIARLASSFWQNYGPVQPRPYPVTQ
jgi:hypothetical protein